VFEIFSGSNVEYWLAGAIELFIDCNVEQLATTAFEFIFAHVDLLTGD